MRELIVPLLNQLAGINESETETESVMVRRIPIVIKIFQTIKRCNIEGMIQNRKSVDDYNKLIKLILVICHKSCEFNYNIVEYITTNFNTITDSQKQGFIIALIELSDSKHRVLQIIHKMIANNESESLLSNCENSSNAVCKNGTVTRNRNHIYKYVTSDLIAHGIYPLYTNEPLCSTLVEIFNNNFLNKNMRSYIYIMGKYEYEVMLCDTPSHVVFGRQKCDTVADTLIAISKLELDIEHNPINKKKYQNKLNKHRKILSYFVHL
jgi:hypothetical protein